MELVEKIARESEDISTIQKIVAEFFHIRPADLNSRKRTQRIAFCRQIAMYLCRKLTIASFPTIGDHFGRDHSTVIHAYNSILRRVTTDAAFGISIKKIEREFTGVSYPKIELFFKPFGDAIQFAAEIGFTSIRRLYEDDEKKQAHRTVGRSRRIAGARTR